MLDQSYYETANEIISRYPLEEKSLIPIIQDIQATYRYLPPDLLDYVAKKIGITETKAYSVASFYENFSFEQKGKYVLKICDGTACHVRKSTPVLQYLRQELGLSETKQTTDDLMFTVEVVSCLGACGLAPAMMVNEQVHPKMTPEKAAAMLRSALELANRAVYDRACAEPDLRGMGTTIVAACVRRGRLTVLHVGDSRAYLVGLRRMQQLTTDHSLVQELVASGQVLPEQAHRHPRRNVITRAVGVGPQVEPDCRTLPFPLGARLLLCTDGLSNTLSEGQMHDFCRGSRDAKQICGRLIAAALARGARDNVTALVLFR